MSALRRLPSVDSILRDERLAGLPRELCVAAVRQVLDRARETIRRGDEPPDDLAAAALAELESARAPSLRRVLNATGVVVHTNLGRAPLSAAALDRVAQRSRAATRTSSSTSRAASAARARSTSRRCCGG